MAGIGLEFRVNYESEATLPRSAVDFGQMIDRWATLGIPMLVQLSVPGGSGADNMALSPKNVLQYELPLGWMRRRNSCALPGQ